MELPKLPEEVAFVQPFLQRAKELRSVDPIISYYCILHAVELIIGTDLHQANSAVKNVTGELMSLLENEKQSPSLLDPKKASILVSDELSHAHVLAFADSLLARAMGQIDSQSATKGTAALLVAAATIFSLEKIWGDLPDSSREKIKFAKYKAATILKAINRGENPNEQVVEALPEDSHAATTRGTSDEPENETNADNHKTKEVSPTETEAVAPDTAGRANHVPTDDKVKPENSLDLPSAPHHFQPSKLSSNLSLPGVPSGKPNDLGLPEIPDMDPTVPFAYKHAPPTPKAEEFDSHDQDAKESSIPNSAPSKPTRDLKNPPSKAYSTQELADIVSNQKLIAEVQKHGKFALSALNYEDYATAKSEFEQALAKLNAMCTS